VAILNPLPGVAVLPLAMLWFGLTERAVLFVIANAAAWPIAINLSTGFKTVNPTIVAVGRNIGLSSRRLITDVLAPAALPYAISGLKTAWAFGWRTIIAAELVFGVAGADGGLGTYINNAKLFLNIPEVFAGLVTIAILGLVFETLFGLLERRTIVRWGMKSST
jgi:NitT/TauT family transport system permease protein